MVSTLANVTVLPKDLWYFRDVLYRLLLTPVFAAAFALCVAEGALRLIDAVRDPDVSNRFVIGRVDPTAAPLTNRLRNRLGYFPLPAGSTSYHEILVNGKLDHSATYTIDPLGHRICAACPHPSHPRQTLTTLGCSFTFGQLVNDDETLAARLQLLLPDTKVTNLGVLGFGPHQILPLITEFPTGVQPAASNTTIYVWMDDHIDRAIGNAVYFTWHPVRSPYWDWGPHGLEERGTFQDRITNSNREFATFLFSKLLMTSALARHLSGELPFRNRDRKENWEKVAQLIQQIQEASRGPLSSSRFAVVFFPGSRWGRKRLIPLLSNRGIQTLDYSQLFNGEPVEKFQIPHDTHPNALAYQRVAEQLAKDLSSASLGPDREVTQWSSQKTQRPSKG